MNKNFPLVKSIKFKTWLYIMSVVAIILLLIYTFQIAGLQKIYEFTKQNEVKSAQAEMLSALKGNENIDDVMGEIMSLSRYHDIYVEIYDGNKELIMSPYIYMEEKTADFNKRYPFNNLISRYTMSRFIDKLNESGKTSMIINVKDKGLNTTSSIVLVDKFLNGNKIYYLITSSSLAPVSATSDLLKRIFLYILIVVLIISVFVSFLIAVSYTRPLRKLSHAAKAVTSGDYSVQIDNKYTDEIGMLISDFNNMTVELSKVDVLRKDLISNVSHELKTPLTMIKGYAETIRDLTGDRKEKREQQLGVIINETDRLSNLITNILDLSYLQAGKVSFKSDEFNLSETLSFLLTRYDIFKDNGFIFETEITPDITVKGDKDRLSQVICNLLDNAVNHSRESKKIIIKLHNNSAPVLEITNFGEPIEKEHLPHIWERFYKIDKSGSNRSTGTGIGLSIVKEILVSHGFDFGVKSSINGTTFWVKFKKLI